MTEARWKDFLELRFHLIANRMRFSNGHLPATNEMKIDMPHRAASTSSQIMSLNSAILVRVEHLADLPDFGFRKLRIQKLVERRFDLLAEMIRIYAATTNAIAASIQSQPVNAPRSAR